VEGAHVREERRGLRELASVTQLARKVVAIGALVSLPVVGADSGATTLLALRAKSIVVANAFAPAGFALVLEPPVKALLRH
jgi:hypothetical protein